MSITNFAWKIRDTKTGLCYNGEKGCHHEIGTRFVKEASLWQAVAVIMRKHGKFPLHWEVVRVELNELDLKVYNATDITISYSLPEMPRGGDIGFDFSMAYILRDLRRDGKMKDTKFIGLRKRKNHHTKLEFVEMMTGLGVEKDRYSVLKDYIVTFEDATAATAPMLAGYMEKIHDMDTIRENIANFLHVEVSEV